MGRGLGFPIILGCVLLSVYGWSRVVSPQRASVYSGDSILSLAQSEDKMELFSHRPSAAEEALISSPGSLSPGERTLHRQRLLIETLDRLISYQHQYRSIHGLFASQLSNLEMRIPEEVSSNYEIKISQTQEGRLTLSALSRGLINPSESVFLDDRYQVSANFALPEPRIEYLRYLALRHVSSLQKASSNFQPLESSVFRGYFRYEIRQDQFGQRSVFAYGLKQPALGLEFNTHELQKHSEEWALHNVWDDFEIEAGSFAPRLGQKLTPVAPRRGITSELRRYARSWANIASIAAASQEPEELNQVPLESSDRPLIIEPIRDEVRAPAQN